MLPIRQRLMRLMGRQSVVVGDMPAGIHVERDLAYGTDAAQRLDVYRPVGKPVGPMLVLVHGGGWSIGDKTGVAVINHKMAHWVPKGYVVVSVNYRLLPLADPLEQAHDVARALAFVQDKAGSWGGDSARLVLVGHSTGAHLAALLAADADLAAAHGVVPWLATVLLDSAALDVVQTLSRPHFPLHARAFGADPAYWRKVSPLHRLRHRPAPLLLVHASARPDSCEQAHRFATAVLALGGRADVLPIALSHADINARLGCDPDYTDKVDTFFRSLGLP